MNCSRGIGRPVPRNRAVVDEVAAPGRVARVAVEVRTATFFLDDALDRLGLVWRVD